MQADTLAAAAGSVSWEAVSAISAAIAAIAAAFAVLTAARSERRRHRAEKRQHRSADYRRLVIEPTDRAIEEFERAAEEVLTAGQEDVRDLCRGGFLHSSVTDRLKELGDNFNRVYHDFSNKLRRGMKAWGNADLLDRIARERQTIQDNVTQSIELLAVDQDRPNFRVQLSDACADIQRILLEHDPVNADPDG